MKYALIDIGSNSIRLTVYKINQDGFKILFKEKEMTGLANYVENDDLSNEGILCAINTLNNFNNNLDLLQIENRKYFATASLRNINNTQEALTKIKQETGIEIEVLSGEQEANCGYLGAMVDFKQDSGVFIDVGGASSEVTIFENSNIISAESYGIGSLKLYHDEVKKILPGEKSLKRLQKRINTSLSNAKGDYENAVAVGGSARACLRLCNKLFNLPNKNRQISIDELNKLYDLLISDDKKAAEIILKYEPERIHTLIPGLSIIKAIVDRYKCQNIFISRYGIREGYLLKEIMGKENEL